MTTQSLTCTIRPECRRQLARIQPGELGCSSCGHVGPRQTFAAGRGRQYGQHPDHRYCPACGRSIDCHGFISGDQLAVLRRTPERESG